MTHTGSTWKPETITRFASDCVETKRTPVLPGAHFLSWFIFQPMVTVPLAISTVEITATASNSPAPIASRRLNAGAPGVFSF